MNKKLGEILVELGLLTEAQIEQALEIQKIKRQKIGRILVGLGYVTRDQITEALSKKLRIPIINCTDLVVPNDLKDYVGRLLAKREIVLPIERKNDVLILAMANPLDYKVIDEITFKTKLKVSPVIAYEQNLIDAIDRNYGNGQPSGAKAPDLFSLNMAVDEEVQFVEDRSAEGDVNLESLYSKSKSPPIVKLVAMVIAEAVQARASDIHIEPRERFVQVRLRVDGDLRNIYKYDKNIHDSVVSRIKIISGLDITNRRLSQDGGTHVSFQGNLVDLRISTLPSIYGEKIVIRLLNQSTGIVSLDELHMPDYIKEPLLEMLNRPQGMFIVTGPTGSGKTTTLYSCLNLIRSEKRNIITIEDPVEYKLDGVTQVQVDESVNRTFPAVLRSVLRQDPDVIKVGEIRDFKTAEIAIKGALTGHFVMSTLHTNNTVATITRLINIGIPSYLLSSALSGLLAQRLVKKICMNCKQEIPLPDEVALICEQHRLPEIATCYAGKGCPQCFHTGYSGRLAVYEFLPITPNLRRLISRNAGEDELFKAAKGEGVVFLFEDGWNKVKAGMTTFEELLAKIPLEYY